MPEIGPSGSMSGEWKRSESHRATPRLYPGPQENSVILRTLGPCVYFRQTTLLP